MNHIDMVGTKWRAWTTAEDVTGECGHGFILRDAAHSCADPVEYVFKLVAGWVPEGVLYVGRCRRHAAALRSDLPSRYIIEITQYQGAQ